MLGTYFEVAYIDAGLPTSKAPPMSFAEFASSPKGDLIGTILKASLPQLVSYSEAGRPALLAVAPQIASAGVPLTNTEKQHVGRWVHRLLGPRGWRPADKKKLPKGCLFRTASVYERVDGTAPARAPARVPRPAARAPAAAGRLASARARVRALPVRPPSVSRFIADKRRAAARER